jgi:Protein of unknown function (DUF1592)/Protein of unknown function (DUF1595)/Protein of unknown function (DUF1585)
MGATGLKRLTRIARSSALWSTAWSALFVAACGQGDSVDQIVAQGGDDSSVGQSPGTDAGTAAGDAMSGASDDAGTGGAHAGDGSAGSGDPAACEESSPVLAEERIARLTFAQVVASVRALLGDALADEVETQFAIGSRSPVPRAFPAIDSPLEGPAVTDALLGKYTGIALLADTYVLEHFDEVTGCGDEPTELCALDFIASFAEQAFRRPVDAAEFESLTVVYDEVLALPGTVADATAATVSAILQWPQFIYRTEFGDAVGTTDPLTPYELASALAYALTDGPPDVELLQAAAAGALASDNEIVAQTERLLAAPGTRKNLESVLYAVFDFGVLESAVHDDAAFTPAFRAAASREIELLFEDTLWSGPLTDLLTRRTSFVNPSLAAIYGLATPSPDADPDAFVLTELPEERGGLLTLPGALSLGPPDWGVLTMAQRGVFVKNKLLCIDPSASLLEPHEDPDIAPYGQALAAFDAIGRYRTLDAAGQPIDSAVVLPAALGGASVQGAVELQAQIAKSPLFASCFARHMLTLALEQSNVARESCAVREVADGFEAKTQSLAELMGRVATSRAFREREVR